MEIDLIRINLPRNLKSMYSDGAKEKDKELLQEYIDALTDEEIIIFNEIKNDLKYSRIKNNITHNSIQLMLKVYDNTSIKTFPYINKIACKNWSIGDGTFAFSLYLLDKSELRDRIYSSFRVKDCLLKKYSFDVQEVFSSINDIEIFLKRKYLIYITTIRPQSILKHFNNINDN